MPCSNIKLGNGVTMIACGRGVNPRKCSYCSRTHTKLCDFVVGFKTMLMSNPPQNGDPRTCDKPLCDACARSVGEDKDHCRIHEIRGDKEAA